MGSTAAIGVVAALDAAATAGAGVTLLSTGLLLGSMRSGRQQKAEHTAREAVDGEITRTHGVLAKPLPDTRPGDLLLHTSTSAE
jgi:hypothetical protein